MARAVAGMQSIVAQTQAHQLASAGEVGRLQAENGSLREKSFGMFQHMRAGQQQERSLLGPEMFF